MHDDDCENNCNVFSFAQGWNGSLRKFDLINILYSIKRECFNVINIVS